MDSNISPFEQISCKTIMKNMNRVTCHLAGQAGYDRDVLLYEINLFYSDEEKLMGIGDKIIKSIARIECPILPAIIDVDKKDKRMVFVFRKPDGDYISERVKRGSFFSNKQIWDLTYSFAKGFSMLNKAGIFPGGFKANNIVFESERWWRLHPDVIAEMINRRIENVEDNPSDLDMKARKTDISCLGRLVCGLVTGDSHFKVLEEGENMIESYGINAIDITGKNSDITKEQDEFIKKMILAVTPNGNGYEDFESIASYLPTII